MTPAAHLHALDRARCHALRAVEMRPVRIAVETSRTEPGLDRVVFAAVVAAACLFASCVGGGVVALGWLIGGM
jgi:hypothetical protein